MSEARTAGIILSGYLLGMIVGFGYSAADPCPASPIEGKCGTASDAAAVGIMAGMLWPFYFSKVLFEQVRKP